MPAPRLMLALFANSAEGDRVVAGAADQCADVLHRACVGAVVQSQCVGPAAKIDGHAVGQCVPSVILSLPPLPVRVVDVGDGDGVGEGAEAQRIGSGAKIDTDVAGRGTQRDGVVAGAAVERLDVGDRAGVGAVGRASDVSAPAPRLTLPFTMAVSRVIVSAPVPPISVSTLLTLPVLPTFAKGELALAAAEIDAHGVAERGAERDVVVAGSAGDRSSVLDTVAVLLKLPRTSVLPPLSGRCWHWRAAPSVTVSPPPPPTIECTCATVSVLPPAARVSVSAPVPRLDAAVGDLGGQRDGIDAGAADQRVDVAHGSGVAPALARVSLLSPVSEIDRHGGGERGVERDRVVRRSRRRCSGYCRPLRCW